MKKITPFLWFDGNAEQAAEYYCSIFKSAKVKQVTHYSKGLPRPEGSVMTVSFELFGQEFVALNGGPEFQFNSAISFVIDCEDQAEVDYYWDKLTADGGKPVACGWLTDKFGLSWQVVPKGFSELISHSDPAKAERVNKAMMKMVKLDLQALKDA